MAKIGTQKKPKRTDSKALPRHAIFESLDVRSPRPVSETLLECIQSGDLDSFRDVLATHIMSANKVHLAQKSGIGRRTLYDILDPKIKFNPALSTLSALIRGLSK